MKKHGYLKRTSKRQKTAADGVIVVRQPEKTVQAVCCIPEEFSAVFPVEARRTHGDIEQDHQYRQ